MKTLHFLFLVAGLALAAAPALAAGGGGSGAATGSSAWSSPTGSTEPEYVAGRQAFDAQDWPTAVQHLKTAVATDPQNADAFNLLGYSLRKSGDVNAAFAAYDKALALDPKHKGAHEYLGEAYLEVGNVAKAEEQLAALDSICFFGCDEYTELKQKIAGYKANHAK